MAFLKKILFSLVIFGKIAFISNAYFAFEPTASVCTKYSKYSSKRLVNGLIVSAKARNILITSCFSSYTKF